MKTVMSAVFLALTIGLTPAADPVPDFEFPQVKVEDPPAPKAEDVSAIPAGALYAIQSKVPLLILDTPAGVVSVKEVQGKATIGGKFVGWKNGAFDLREFAGPYTYLVIPSADGKVELMVGPAEKASRDKMVRKQLEVVSGDCEKPRPKPKPLPEEDQFTKDLRAALAADPADERKLVPKLVEFYAGAGKEIDLQTNWEALFIRLRAKATELGTDGKLHNVAVVISAKLKTVFPTGTGLANRTITADERAAAKAVFDDVTTHLKKL